MRSVLEFIRSRPARVYGLAVALVALGVEFGVSLPETGILGVVAAVVALVTGEAVQRTEDRKTVEALATKVPEDLL